MKYLYPFLIDSFVKNLHAMQIFFCYYPTSKIPVDQTNNFSRCYKKNASMAKATFELIEALRTTALNLKNGAYHSWGHHGACNCGNLVQSVTQFSKEEILRHAQQSTGEWTELAREFCPVTNAPLALIFFRLEAIGLNSTDIHHVEYLSSPAVLRRLPGGHRWLKRNRKDDAILYFETFAGILEEELLNAIEIPDIITLRNTRNVKSLEKIMSRI